ncbi:MAG: OmpA family protein [Terracidiphilus sp.]|jgi:outer membrane protein OmpA-like peptidoglycan-associated protein
MRLNVKMISVAAFAIFLAPAILLHAEKAAKPSTDASKDNAVDSSPIPDAEPAASTAVAKPNSSRHDIGTPKVELFLGYSYLRAVPAPADGNRLVWLNGGSTSIVYNFTRHLGLVGDFGGLDDSKIRLAGIGANSSSTVDSSGLAYTYLFGPRLSFRNHERFTPFAQVLFGGIHASKATVSSGCTGAGCTVLPEENSFAMTAGGGLDLKVRPHLAIRMIQAEYLMTNFEDLTTGKNATQNDMRLSSGIVFRFGGNNAPRPLITLSCSTNPASVFPGDPITVTAAASNLDSKLNVIYSLTAPGVTVNSATATVATATLAPGPYTVNCGVKEGKPGKEGLKPWESATTTASFTVKAFGPPTISCSATPSDIKPGETSNISAAGVSPQNRPLTYNYSAASGIVSGSGATAVFNSTGSPNGPTAITCTVADDKGQTATANTIVTIAAPPTPTPPPEQVRLEARLALHSIFFPTAQPRTEHPEGGLVASQQQTLITLATDFKSYLTFKPDAHLTLSGHADARGSVDVNQALSERRVVRTKQFMVEQGVPEASIETRSLGKDQELTDSQVKELVEQNPDLSVADREKILRDLTVIVLAQNRRVDITLSTTGQQSVRLYPFNAADSLTLLDKKVPAPHKKLATVTKK